MMRTEDPLNAELMQYLVERGELDGQGVMTCQTGIDRAKLTQRGEFGALWPKIWYKQVDK